MRPWSLHCSNNGFEVGSVAEAAIPVIVDVHEDDICSGAQSQLGSKVRNRAKQLASRKGLSSEGGCW